MEAGSGLLMLLEAARRALEGGSLKDVQQLLEGFRSVFVETLSDYWSAKLGLAKAYLSTVQRYVEVLAKAISNGQGRSFDEAKLLAEILSWLRIGNGDCVLAKVLKGFELNGRFVERSKYVCVSLDLAPKLEAAYFIETLRLFPEARAGEVER
jgi:hypothetical protein